MAISARMLAVIQKIEAAEAKHLARLRESAKQDKDAKLSAKKRAAARSVEARSATQKRKSGRSSFV